MPPKKGTTKAKASTRRKATATTASTASKKRKSPTPSSLANGNTSAIPPLILPPSLSGRPLPTLILDSGGWTIKHDVISPPTPTATAVNTSNNNSNPSSSTQSTSSSSSSSSSPKQSYNVIAKPKHVLTTLLSNEINTIQNKSNLIFKRPLERGYTTDLGVQFQIWDYILHLESLECIHSFSNGGVQGGVLSLQNNANGGKQKKQRVSSSRVSPIVGSSSLSSSSSSSSTIYTHTAAVICLHQPFTPRNILEKEDEIFFRDFGFGRVHRMLGVCCSAYEYLKLVKEQQEDEECNDDNNEIVKKKKKKKINEYGCSILENDNTGCCCVIDSGFSLTHIVPTVDARAITKGIRRINIGGKLLTNLLKEVISYRQFNMRDEFYNINDAKEALCYLSTQLEKDLQYARDETRTGCRKFDREFVLPDYTQTFQGSVRLPLRLQMILEEERRKKEMGDGNNEENDEDDDDEDDEDYEEKNDTNNMDVDDDDDDVDGNNNNEEDGEDSDNETEEQIRRRIMKQKEAERRQREFEEEQQQALLLSVERFTIPEILFRPSDIQMKQLGLAEAIVQSIEACDPIYHAAMYHNIVLTGGNVKFPNFKERLEVELRSIAPIEYEIRVYVPDDPITFAFQGAQSMVKNEGYTIGVDRAQWEVKKQSGEAFNLWNSKGDDGISEGHCTI